MTQEIKSLQAPRLQLFNSFNVNSVVTTHNIDGADGKLKLKNFYVVARSGSRGGEVIGCTAAKLA